MEISSEALEIGKKDPHKMFLTLNWILSSEIMKMIYEISKDNNLSSAVAVKARIQEVKKYWFESYGIISQASAEMSNNLRDINSETDTPNNCQK